MSYLDPFRITRRDTGQYVVVKGGDYTYTTRKDGATEFAKRVTAERNFEKLRLDTATHCVVPSVDID